MTLPEYDLDESIPDQFLKLKMVLWVSSYGRFIGKKEFRPQCKVLCFGVSFWSVFLVERIPSHELVPSRFPAQVLLISSNNSIICRRGKGCGTNWGDGRSDQNKRSQGLKGKCHKIEKE